MSGALSLPAARGRPLRMGDKEQSARAAAGRLQSRARSTQRPSMADDRNPRLRSPARTRPARSERRRLDVPIASPGRALRHESDSSSHPVQTVATIEQQRPHRDSQAAESPGRCSSRRESGTGPRATGRAERRWRISGSLASALQLDQGSDALLDAKSVAFVEEQQRGPLLVGTGCKHPPCPSLRFANRSSGLGRARS